MLNVLSETKQNQHECHRIYRYDIPKTVLNCMKFEVGKSQLT